MAGPCAELHSLPKACIAESVWQSLVSLQVRDRRVSLEKDERQGIMVIPCLGRGSRCGEERADSGNRTISHPDACAVCDLHSTDTLECWLPQLQARRCLGEGAVRHGLLHGAVGAMEAGAVLLSLDGNGARIIVRLHTAARLSLPLRVVSFAAICSLQHPRQWADRTVG